MSRHTERVKGHMFSLICRNWQSWGNSSAELPWWHPLWPHATLSKNISMISSLSLMVAGHYDDNFTLLIRWLPLWLGGTTSWVSFNSSSVYSPTSTAYTDNNKVYWSFTIILSKVNVPLGELRGALDVFRGQTLTFKKVMWEWLHCGDVSLSLLRSSVSSLLLYPWGRPWLGRVTLHTKAAPFALLTSGDIPVGRAERGREGCVITMTNNDMDSNHECAGQSVICSPSPCNTLVRVGNAVHREHIEKCSEHLQ